MRERTGKNLTCCVCKKKYYVPKHRAHKSKFCSLECMNKGQYLSIEKQCLHCRKKFKVSNSKAKQKYCSLDCRCGSKMNEKEARKKQREADKKRRGRNGSRAYRKIAFSQKEARCEICGYNEFVFCLDVHHVDGNPLNNHIDNLSILCAICHRKLHRKKIELIPEN